MYKTKGDDESRKKEYSNAIHLYSEGLKLNCKDDVLNAKLYNNKALAHLRSGKTFFPVGGGGIHKSKPLPFYTSSLIEKVSLSYT